MKKSKSNIQLDYYRSENVNPVVIDTSSNNWINHKMQRVNLYENHLHIPIQYFQDKHIIEFGPNGGENSLILAEFGASMTLVEPRIDMHANIVKLYKKASLYDNLIGIYDDTLESFVRDRDYTIAIAEGFFNALPDRLNAISSICSLDSEFVIFTYSERAGHFFESLKRLIFTRIIEIENKNIFDFNSVLSVAKKLFFDNYKALKTSRNFTSWVKDILINPTGSSASIDSFSDLALNFSKLGYYYYSGSPSWDSRHSHKWYKNISNDNLIEKYRENIPFFISGIPGEKIGEECISKINSMTEKFLDYSSGLIDFKQIECLSGLDPLEWEYANDINELITLLSKANHEKIISYYLQSKLSDLWGMPHHYVCLKKKSN